MGSIIPLSASNGGAPVILDSKALPGKLVHENPADSGGNDLIRDILVGNLNTRQISIWTKITGPGVDPVFDRSEMLRIDVPPSAEGTQVRQFYTPFVLAPGYSYYISVDLQPDDIPPYLYGYVERFAVSQFYGYGGLITTLAGDAPDILAGNWATIPFQQSRPGVPVNVDTDPGNNRLAFEVPGVWGVSAYVSLSFNKVSNTDRLLYLRFWNETDGVEVSDSPFPLYVEEGTTGGSWAIPVTPIDVPDDLVNKWIRAEIGGSADNFTGIRLAKAGMNAYLLNPEL